MTFPLAILLFLYVAFLIFFCVVSAMNIYTVIRNGAFDRKNTTVVVAYSIVAAALVILSVVYLLGVDWGTSVDIPLPSFETNLT